MNKKDSMRILQDIRAKFKYSTKISCKKFKKQNVLYFSHAEQKKKKELAIDQAKETEENLQEEIKMFQQLTALE